MRSEKNRRQPKTNFGRLVGFGRPKKDPTTQVEKRLIIGLVVVGLLVIGSLVILGVQGQIKYSAETHQATAQFLQLCGDMVKLNYLNPYPVPTVFGCP